MEGYSGNRSVKKTFTRTDCVQYTAKLLGSARTGFGPSRLDYAMAVADEAESLYLSRYKAEKQALPEEEQLNAEIIWITSMLAVAQAFTHITFEDIMNLTNVEIAGYINIVNPDTRLPVFERIKKFLIMLASGTNLAKLIALAKQTAAIKMIGDDTSAVKDPAYLYELAECLKHLNPVTKWSRKVYREWEVCRNIVNAWGLQRRIPWQTSRPFLHWSLDFTKEHNDLKLIFELD